MINKKFALIATLLSFVILFIPSVSAQTSGDWNISDDFGGELFPTPSPSPNPNYVKTANNAVNNSYAALGLVSVSLFVLAAVLIMGAARDDTGENKGMIAGIGVLIGTVMLLVIGFALINSFTASLGL